MFPSTIRLKHLSAFSEVKPPFTSILASDPTAFRMCINVSLLKGQGKIKLLYEGILVQLLRRV